MNDHPYMPLFWGDLLKQTAFWSGEERALLIVLAAVQWWNGPLPLDLTKLAAGIDYEERTFRELWHRRVHTLFVAKPEGYIHEETEVRRRAVARLSGARRAAGKESGKVRRERSTRRDEAEPEPALEQTREALLEQNTAHDVRTKQRTNAGASDRTPIQSNPIQSKPVQEPPLSESLSVGRASTAQHPPVGADPPPSASAATPSNGNGRAPPRKRRFPADYPTEALRAWAEENTPRVNFDAELALLRDHEFRDPHSDWDAVARNWLRRAEKQPTRGGEEHLTRFERHKRRLYGA